MACVAVCEFRLPPVFWETPEVLDEADGHLQDALNILERESFLWASAYIETWLKVRRLEHDNGKVE